MAKKPFQNRPLSPHLTIYRPQLTSVTSIFHRITGNALIVTALAVVLWFVSAAISPKFFAYMNGFLLSWFGKIFLALSLWWLWYHYLAGIRHLIWDKGYGLDLSMAYKLGWVVILLSLLLTLVTLFIL